MTADRHNVTGMIFAAGLGTRLAPLTDTMPKALVPVAGKPMLERVIERFAGAGVRRIVVNVHHFADKIVDFLQKNNNFGLEIVISDETDLLLDTGGALVKAMPLFEDSDAVLVHNADILSDIDLAVLLECHFKSGNDATLAIRRRDTTRYLYFTRPEMRLAGWGNTRTGETLPAGFDPASSDLYERYAFCGVHVISARALADLKRFTDSHVFSIIPFYADECNRLMITGFVPEKPFRWFDIGTLDKLHEAERLYFQQDNSQR